MHFVTPILVALLPTMVLSAAKPTRESKFKAVAAKNGGIVTLDSATYDEITAGSRNYSVSILLTAMADQYKCQPCQ